MSSMGPENISVNELTVAVRYFRHWHHYQQGKNELRVIRISQANLVGIIRITSAIFAGDHLSNLYRF